MLVPLYNPSRELHLLLRPRGNTDKQAWALTTSQNKRPKWKGGNLSHCQRAVSPSNDHASLPPVLRSHLCLSQSDTSLKIQKESPTPPSPSLSYCIHCNWSRFKLFLCFSFALSIFLLVPMSSPLKLWSPGISEIKQTIPGRHFERKWWDLQKVGLWRLWEHSRSILKSLWFMQVIAVYLIQSSKIEMHC